MSRGFGYVSFHEESVAQEAIAKVDGTIIEGSTVVVTKFLPRGGRQTTCSDGSTFTKVYVRDVEFASEADLVEMFKEFGLVTSVIIANDKDTRQFALLEFSTNAEAVMVGFRYQSVC